MATPKLDWSVDLAQPKVNRLVASLVTELTRLRAPLDNPVLVPLGSSTDAVIAALQTIGLFRQE
jgi:hypothetical protein